MAPRTSRAISLLLFSLSWATCHCQHQPCHVPGISQEEFAELLNPRPSADQTVLLNLPFARLFCSPSVARYLVVGNWSQRHLLQLDAAVAHPAGSGPPPTPGDGWRVTDVTEASSVGAFDFLLMLQATAGATLLSPDSGYFAALMACNPQFCRSVGSAKFQTAPASVAAVEAWSLAMIIGVSVGGGVGLLVLVVVAVAVPVARRRPSTKDAGGGGGGDETDGGNENEPGSLAYDKPGAIRVKANSTYARPDISTRGPEIHAPGMDGDVDYPYEQVQEAPATAATVMSTFAPASVVSNSLVSLQLPDVVSAAERTGSLPAQAFQNHCYPGDTGGSLGFNHEDQSLGGDDSTGSLPAEEFKNPSYYPASNSSFGSFGIDKEERLAMDKNSISLGAIAETLE